MDPFGGHAHDHDHDNDYDFDHSHGHDHDHSYDHDQGHSHDHAHEHGHGHEHGHDHAHGQDSESNYTESRHFQEVLLSFRGYERHSLKLIHQKKKYFHKLRPEDRAALPGLLDRLAKCETAISINARLIQKVVAPHQLFLNSSIGTNELNDDDINVNQLSEMNMDRVRVVLKQIAREWTSAGERERQQAFSPLLEVVEARYPDAGSRSKIRVLVPGAGLGRLPWEFAKRGFAVQGNEFSYYMLLTANFILNLSHRDPAAAQRGQLNQIAFYPFVHQVNNVVSEADQLACLNTPDVNPRDLPKSDAEFSMVGGEFIEVYHSQRESWDCICTCFFIDTAHNIVQYVRTIEYILKPGGIWVNLGPLLYHFADMYTDLSVEPTLEELLHVVRHLGFNVTNKPLQRCAYTSNKESMYRTEYDCAFFIAEKKTNIPRLTEFPSSTTDS